jgi:GNAT superfamily N-acetyltransferase
VDAGPATDVVVRPGAPADADVLRLVADQEREMASRWESDDPGPSVVSGARFLVAERAGRPVGCVAVQALGSATGEVKRMYVAPHARRRGIGRVLLSAAEELAASLGYAALRLETGTRQPEAVALYESAGWSRIPPYGYWRTARRASASRSG